MNTRPGRGVDGGATRPAAVVAACCLAQFLVVVNASIINVALPVVQTSLHFAMADLHWVINAYTVVLCGFLLLGGRIADLFGRRRVFLAALLLFMAASLLAGLAWDARLLVTARALQGLAAAVLTPTSLAVLAATFTDTARQVRAYSLWGAMAGAGGAVGVLAGGVIVQVLSWRWTFLVNLPIGAVLFALAAAGIARAAQPPRRMSLDVAGAVCVTAGLTLVVYGLARSAQRGWSTIEVLGAMVAGLILLVVFVADQAWWARQPLVPLEIFRNRSVTAANAAAMACGAALLTVFYVLALQLQQVVGYSPLLVGAAFLPLSLGVLVGARSVASLVTSLGARPVLLGAQGVGIVGLVWLSRVGPDARFVTDLAGPIFLLGLAQGMIITCLARAGTADVPAGQLGLASGLLNTTRQLGSALGLAALVSVATARTAAAGGRDSASALAAGYGAACLVAAGFLVLGMLAAGAVPRRVEVAPPVRPVAVPR